MNEMNLKKPAILALAILLTLIALVSAVQNYVVTVVHGGVQLSWLRILSFHLPFWWFWLLATPVIVLLGKRFPLHRGHLISSISIHLSASILMAIVHQFLTAIWCNTIYQSLYYMPVFEKLWYRLLNLSWAFVDFMIYWAILGGFFTLAYYVKYRERELRCSQLEVQLVESRLQALKMQIHPHFLFNTMNALSTIVMKEQTEQAMKMISRFSDFLRMTLEETGKQQVPLDQELGFIQSYLEVEKIRFQEKLQVHFDVEPNTLSAFVPNLILQPIVENAIRYAVLPKESTGEVSIRAWRLNGTLQLQVRDNGPGMPKNSDSDSSTGIGLKNTRARLTNLYGTHHQFDLENLPEGGLQVTLAIPFQQNINDCSTSTVIYSN